MNSAVNSPFSPGLWSATRTSTQRLSSSAVDGDLFAFIPGKDWSIPWNLLTSVSRKPAWRLWALNFLVTSSLNTSATVG